MRASLVSGLLLCSACFFPADRGALLENKVDSISAENERLKVALKDTTDKLEQTTSRLQDALSQLDTASRTTGANINVKVDTAIQDVASLRGQLEASQYKLQELEQKLASQPATSATPSAEPKKDEVKRPDEPKDFLKLAHDKLKDDVELGRKLYTEFLKKWPKDEGAGEAHFALGETYFNESPQKCREAIYEYGKVIQDFPKAPSTPVAYLRSSDCFKVLKMSAEAKLALETVIKEYPKSEAAKTAKTKLTEPAKPPPAPAAKGAKK